jgi:hypothetical protein
MSSETNGKKAKLAMRRQRGSVRRNARTERGNTLVEFALVSVFIVPLLMGTVNVGMGLARTIQASQVSRDAGHMFVRQVDFSLAGNKQIIVRLAEGTGMTIDGGRGVVTLTRVGYVGEADCLAAGLSTGECTNLNHPVIKQRLTIGNTSMRASNFGTPPSNLVASDGNISAGDYLTNPALRATGFGGLLQLEPGELAYVSEAFFEAPEWSFPQTVFEGTGVYARTIF